jgi:spore coat polysaccharide biosynthesis protein SpsF
MVLAILQARVSSTRLPRKVLLPILGRTMLECQLERVRASKFLDKIIVATSDQPEDSPIAELCEAGGIECYRGSLEDVLDRFYQAANQHQPKFVVRLTGDCPLLDPEILDSVIQFHIKGGFDYTSNCLEPSFPDGLDAEIMNFSTLQEIWRLAKRPIEREHVTTYILHHRVRFKIGNFKN